MPSAFDHVTYMPTPSPDRKWEAGPDDEDEDVASLAELLVVVVYLSVLSVVGTIGNAIVLYVFSTRRDQLVSTFFILVLAIVDFSTCLIVIPYTIFMEYYNFRIEKDVVCKIYFFLITSNIPFSALIMVAIALDRYLCICHPHIHAMNVLRAKGLIAALGVFAAGQGVCVSLINGVYKLRTVANSTFVPLDCTSVALDCVNNSMATGFNDSEAEVHLVNVETMELVNTGMCKATNLIISMDFQWYYQKLNTATYPLCLIIVAVLYTLIYRSVLTRRNLRLSQKSRSLALVESLSTAVVRPGLLINGPPLVSGIRSTDAALCPSASPASTAASTAVATDPVKQMPPPPQQRRSEGSTTFRRSGLLRRASRLDAFRLANLKTAAMLFVVTFVFVVTFMPAFLMVLQLLPYNIVVFYMYFANNVANPVIYSFMNRNFRSDLQRLFCRSRKPNNTDVI